MKLQGLGIAQGEFAVSNEDGLYISTLLGSCVAVCIFDEVARIGGMNHFLLPGDKKEAGLVPDTKLGVHLMELLINGMLKAGGTKSHFRVKLFGGGNTVVGLGDIGKRNVEFAREYLLYENIAVIGGSVGGSHGRRVRFWPTSGKAQQSFIAAPQVLEPINNLNIRKVHNGGELELF